MKQTAITLLAAVALFTGCKKSSSSSPSNNNGSSTEPFKNTVTITDNGVTHTATETWGNTKSEQFIVVFLLLTGHGAGNSNCGISVTDPAADFRLDVYGDYGPDNGIGKYTKAVSSIGANTYTEKYNSNRAWGMDSFQINVIAVTNGLATGNMTYWLQDGTDRKTITGTFSCYK